MDHIHMAANHGHPHNHHQSDLDPDVMEISPSSLAWSLTTTNRKPTPKGPSNVIHIDDGDEASSSEPAAAVITIPDDYQNNNNNNNKQPMPMSMEEEEEHNADFQMQFNITSSDHHPASSSTFYASQNGHPLKFNNFNDVACIPVDDNDYGEIEDLDFYEDLDYEEMDFDGVYFYDDSDSYKSNLAAKFDDLDLPPGVEATVPWLQKLEIPKKVKKTLIDGEVTQNYKQFKRFETVPDFSDHHYLTKANAVNFVGKKPPKGWMKKIQHEWKVLENDLPDTIFVRVCEERMDLLRAAIIGPAGTPYHDGIFFFDTVFPLEYPNSPPLVYYHSGGLRLNPNLYNCGKVCLSLLGTWSGKGCEKWNPTKSTMLQVLVSIQALILNAKPYFNEPGYESSVGTPSGEKKAMAYNEDTFLLSCKTMMYSLRRPPKHFEDFVGGHFCERGRAILVTCRAYMKGAQVGCVDGKGVQDVDEGDKSCSTSFRISLKRIYEDLLMEFTVKGADCDDLLAEKVKAGSSSASAPDLTLRL